MDGLRALAELDISRIHDEAAPAKKSRVKPLAFCIIQNETNYNVRRTHLDHALVPAFFRDCLPEEGDGNSVRLKLACLGPMGTESNPDKSVWRDIFKEMDLDPYFGHLVAIKAYGFHHSMRQSESVDSQIGSYFLGTSTVWNAWTTEWDPIFKVFTVKYLIVYSECERDPTFGRPSAVLRNLEIFARHSGSGLYIPLVLAVENVRRRGWKTGNMLQVIRDIETETGHGSSGVGPFKAQGEAITQLTARLGATHNQLSSGLKHLSMVDDLCAHMIDLHVELETGEVGKNRQPAESDKSIMKAVELLKQQSAAIKEQIRYLEKRVKNQSTVLFSFLTHQDSTANIALANASTKFAAASAKFTEAAHRDASSMKTIAVLTMGYLPATFLATLFSMPSMGWDQSDKFAIYWACAIPATVITFVLWAGITQREEMMRLVKAIRGRRYPGKQMQGLEMMASQGTNDRGRV
ncbi:hypothetical protein QBC43DRAFT_297201 [Cladorrhinum sp. PSN259]|nr:hypothetical protein QBC43DRAFT_297201 [Cladorrhinum sp. PSN259]